MSSTGKPALNLKTCYEKLRSLLSPAAETVVTKMNEISKLPTPINPEKCRSELLVVGKYESSGNLVLHKNLAYFRFSDACWIDDKTELPVDTPITHWISADDQHILN